MDEIWKKPDVKHERFYDEVAELGVERVKLEVHGTTDFGPGGIGQLHERLSFHCYNAKGLLVVTKASVTAASFNMTNLNYKEISQDVCNLSTFNFGVQILFSNP